MESVCSYRKVSYCGWRVDVAAGRFGTVGEVDVTGRLGTVGEWM